jgi:hypothetical protein
MALSCGLYLQSRYEHRQYDSFGISGQKTNAEHEGELEANKYFSLTSIGPCIVIYSYSTTNNIHLLSQIIYSCKTLHMFRTVFPSIIWRSKLRIQQRYISNSCCYLLLAAGNSSCLTYTVAVYTVYELLMMDGKNVRNM